MSLSFKYVKTSTRNFGCWLFRKDESVTGQKKSKHLDEYSEEGLGKMLHHSLANSVPEQQQLCKNLLLNLDTRSF